MATSEIENDSCTAEPNRTPGSAEGLDPDRHGDETERDTCEPNFTPGMSEGSEAVVEAALEHHVS